MLATVFVVLFLAIVAVLHFLSQESQEKALRAAMSDIRKSYALLSAEQNPSPGILRAKAFLQRWV